jgi:hypothetical protein
MRKTHLVNPASNQLLHSRTLDTPDILFNKREEPGSIPGFLI